MAQKLDRRWWRWLGINPQNYLTDALQRLPAMKIRQVKELAPSHWKPRCRWCIQTARWLHWSTPALADSARWRLWKLRLDAYRLTLDAARAKLSCSGENLRLCGNLETPAAAQCDAGWRESVFD
jgi:hypothetical protein